LHRPPSDTCHILMFAQCVRQQASASQAYRSTLIEGGARQGPSMPLIKVPQSTPQGNISFSRAWCKHKEVVCITAVSDESRFPHQLRHKSSQGTLAVIKVPGVLVCRCASGIFATWRQPPDAPCPFPRMHLLVHRSLCLATRPSAGALLSFLRWYFD
jgi:hypothetical protein